MIELLKTTLAQNNIPLPEPYSGIPVTETSTILKTVAEIAEHLQFSNILTETLILPKLNEKCTSYRQQRFK